MHTPSILKADELHYIRPVQVPCAQAIPGIWDQTHVLSSWRPLAWRLRLPPAAPRPCASRSAPPAEGAFTFKFCAVPMFPMPCFGYTPQSVTHFNTSNLDYCDVHTLGIESCWAYRIEPCCETWTRCGCVRAWSGHGCGCDCGSCTRASLGFPQSRTLPWLRLQASSCPPSLVAQISVQHRRGS